MRAELEAIKNKVDWLGTDLKEKDIKLRDILCAILNLLDKALPIDRSDDV